MNWDFLNAQTFQWLTALVAYIAGAFLVIKQRMRHPEASYGARTEAGLVLVVVGNVPIIGILIYLWFVYGFFAAVVAYVIAVIASFFFAAGKSLFYPFLE